MRTCRASWASVLFAGGQGGGGARRLRSKQREHSGSANGKQTARMREAQRSVSVRARSAYRCREARDRLGRASRHRASAAARSTPANRRDAPHTASCRARGAARWSCTAAAATAHLDRGEDDGDRRHAAHEDRHSLEPFGVEQLHDLLRSPTAHRACGMQRALSMTLRHAASTARAAMHMQREMQRRLSAKLRAYCVESVTLHGGARRTSELPPARARSSAVMR